jgi:hypothetical protein
MFRLIREFLFGKKQDLPTFENGVPASGAYSGMPKPEQKTTANPSADLKHTRMTRVENEIAVNSQLAEQAKQHVGTGKVAAISEPIVTATTEPVKATRTRKPRTPKPKA